MLDLLAAIQSADPPSLVLWGLFVLAAGMYPVGFMLGAECSPCCNQNPCQLCETGDLPDTVTVTLDGLQDQSPGPDLITLSFSSCFGGGAAARVTAPGGDPETDKGPISAVSLTNAGSGYAKLGRVAPTISVSGGGGSGATFTPTITSSNDACGIPSWSIASVSAKNGIGYVDGEQLAVTIADGDTEATAASMIVNTTRTQPTLTASASPGSGAVFSVTLSENLGNPKTWRVASVSVANGGTGYTDGDTLTFAGGPATKVNVEAAAYIYTGRSIPTLSGGAASPGSGAVLSPTLTQYTDWSGRPYWSVTAFTITNGGSGYSEFDQVFITIDDGAANPWSPFSGYVSSVDANGAITGIAIDYGGEFYKDTGEIASVELWWGGEYYDDDGVPTGVTVQHGGQYYREDASVPPYVATVTVSVSSQSPPSEGTGAQITANVGDDPQDAATFGKITGLTIEDGGDNYLAWVWLNSLCCGWYWNGKPVVLKRTGCDYEHRMCGGWNNNRGKGRLELRYIGPSLPPMLVLHTELSGEMNNSQVCNTTFTAPANVTNCSELDGLVLYQTNGSGTATIEAGGEYDETYKAGWCHPCCQGEEPFDSEIVVSVESLENGYHNVYVPSGDYALGYNFFYGGYVYLNSPAEAVVVTISLRIRLCDTECDECIKKCMVDAWCAIELLPRTRFNPPERDMRECGLFGLEYGSEEYNAASCAAYCTNDAPICKPTGTYNFYLPRWSDLWGDDAPAGANFCAENTQPGIYADENGFPVEGPPIQHLNVFVLTVVDD